MSKIPRFIIWICSKFTNDEIQKIVDGLLTILKTGNTAIKPKDELKEKHPNYRNFYVDPLPPLTQVHTEKNEKNYKQILDEYLSSNGKPLQPIKHRNSSNKMPDNITCSHCGAPSKYLYFNDGKKRTQIRCKVCSQLFQINKRYRKNDKTKFFCPHCNKALFKWKERNDVTIYKCSNDRCPHRIQALNRLNSDELKLISNRSSQFKLCYQFREYHYDPTGIKHSHPDTPSVDLSKIHNSQHILGLILTFYVSFALSARTTVSILHSVFNIKLSHQTILNYAASAAFYCHNFNSKYKGPIDDLCAGDETYIKVMGKQHYVFFFISSKSLKITSYNVADNRGVVPAIAAMTETIRTAGDDQKIKLITDGNPSYPAGIHYINMNIENNSNKLEHRKVIGLQNLDKESEEFRPFKQLIERLNRTYKHHVKPAHGFNSFNGAVALTTLFVTNYNFLRPHTTLNKKTPIQLSQLENITTLQGKWIKLLSMAFN